MLLKNRKNYDIVRCFGSGWLSLYVIVISKLLKKKIIIDLTSLELMIRLQKTKMIYLK